MITLRVRRTLLLRSIVDIVSITRDYTPQSLYYCLFAPHICMVLFSAVARVSEAPPEISRGAPHTLLAYYYELQ